MHAEISEAAPLISAPIPTKPSRPVDPTRTSSSQPSRKLEQGVTGAIGKPGVTAPPTIGAASANHGKIPGQLAIAHRQSKDER